MAIQSPPAVRYCGRCGAPIAPGATFCGHCGTPVAVQAPVAPPQYYYPQAPQQAYPTARQFKLAPVMIAGGLVAILLVIALVVTAFAVAQSSGTHATCRTNCAPKFVTPLPEQATYKSTAFKYQVNYPSAWTVSSQDANGISLGTKIGSVQVVGTSAGSADQVLQSTVNNLPSTKFQDVTLVSNLKGAHIGDQDGIGSIYSANFIGASQSATKVRIAVIVASHNGVTVAIVAIDPADTKNYPSGMPEGQEFDYLCTEFVWA
ncbi:MAG TPA: zinc ribbon domain-containing protein [Candidatus Dormibacteraeota bacterium]|nr:zinc ribbon domain-containing protein [Candidatus Dormibacteraeota bacterium]